MGPMVHGFWTFNLNFSLSSRNMGEQRKTLKVERKKTVYILYPYLSFRSTQIGRVNAVLAQ